MKKQQAKSSWIVALTLVLATAMTAAAQDKPPSQISNLKSESRVGVDAARKLNLTLRDAITQALENNRDIEVEKLNVQMNEFDLRAGYGVYDPVISTGLFYNRQTSPVASILAGGRNGRLLTDSVSNNTALTQRVMREGGVFQGSFDNYRDTTQNLFNSINPQYTSRLNFSFTQPLWKNRTIDLSRRQIKLAKKRLDISDSQFRQRAIEIIAQVQRAYWDLVFARRDREIKRESVELADTQLKHNERLVEAGTLAPADIISARVELERRNDEAEAALEAIQRAENALKNLMLQPSNGELWQTELIPVEMPQVDSTASLPLTDALKLAHANRPEMQQFHLRGDLNQIDVDYFRNQTKPQIDLVATYGTVGVAGSQRTETNFFQASNELLYGSINNLISRVNTLTPGSPPLPPLLVTGGAGVPDFLTGGYGQSLANLFKNEFRTWRFGVNINLPLRNRTAQANLGRALAEGRQIDVQRQKLEQTIEVEVRNALQAVETAKRRVEAAKNSRTNAELQYQSELRKFDAGQSTNFLVLDRQNALSAARGRELRALTDYTKAVAEAQRALSTTLSSNSVEVQSAVAVAAAAWWAGFALYLRSFISTTSLVQRRARRRVVLPSFDQAKLKIKSDLKSVNCTALPPSSGCAQIFATSPCVLM
jgi:HAE1 family hydrophobic/amphiphilic exporter-1